MFGTYLFHYQDDVVYYCHFYPVCAMVIFVTWGGARFSDVVMVVSASFNDED